MRKQLVLVADDDAPILRLVRTKLQSDGYGVITAMNGEEAVAAFERERPDIVVLDLMMPVMDGYEAMQQIRQSADVPVVILTARSAGPEKIRGLDLGADDYVTKPFNPEELSARIAAVLRRTSGSQVPTTQVLDYGRLTIDLGKRRIIADGHEVELSRTEWELLYQLASNAGRVMLHSELLSRIWGPEFRDETYYLRTWVSRLRAKLEQDRDNPTLIRTFPGMGYRLDPPGSE
jgi:two-component system, OmpR family, KDP operon response regulator KdpE